MSKLTGSGHKRGKIKESTCREQFVFKKVTPEGPFLYWFMTWEWSGPQALRGAGHSAYKWTDLPTKGLTLSHYGVKERNLKGYSS